MNITPITATTPSCFGVMCPNHSKCQRYHLIDGAPAHQQRIGTCDDNGERPLFVPVKEVA